MRKFIYGLVVSLVMCLPIFAQNQVNNAETLYTPNSSVLLAVNDIKTVPKDDRQYIRYLSLYNIPKAKRRAYTQTASFIINSLSRRKQMYLPEVVKDSENTLLRINLYNYAIDAEAWERLGNNGSGDVPSPEPYFHSPIEKVIAPVDTQVIVKYRTITGYDVYGRPYYYQQPYQEEVTSTEKPIKKQILGHGLWLDPKAITYLAKTTYSDFPVIRADWFIANACLPPAYYDLLGLGDNIKDFEKLVLANQALSLKKNAATKGTVIKSTVARNNRTLTRVGALTGVGGYLWVSHDTLKSKDDRDYLRDILDEKFDATEDIGTLSNGLQAYFLTNGKGERQNEAPNKIAIDDTAADRTVRNGRSCMICHSLGIQPIDDEVRKITEKLSRQDKVDLYIVDKKDRIKVFDLFGDELETVVATDQGVYTAAVLKATGLKAEENANQFAKIYDGYVETLMTFEDVAREVAVPPEKLEKYIALSDDPHILGLTKKPIRPLRRDQWESGFARFMLIVTSGE